MLPEADLYVACGDMLPNDPCAQWWHLESGDRRVFPWNRTPTGKWLFEHRVIVKEHEREFQREFLDEHVGAISRLMPSKSAPVVFVQGNHDFVAYAKLFEGMDVHQQLKHDETLELAGLRIGGGPGINYIQGEWNWEMTQPEQNDVFSKVPSEIDLLVTHAPPVNVLDYAGCHYGSPAIANLVARMWTYRERPALKTHVFGHIHEQGGSEDLVDHMDGEYMEYGLRFVNAATTAMCFEVKV